MFNLNITLVEGGYDPMRSEQGIENPVYDDDEWEYE